MIRLEAQRVIGFNRIVSGVLKLISEELVHQPDAAAFLKLVDQNTSASRGDALQRKVELCAAVASDRAKNVAGQTLGMDANERRIFGGEVAPDERDNAFGLI